MNTTVFYGVALAVAGFVINLISYFAGLQSDHIKYSQYVQWVTMTVIFVGFYLSADAKRKEGPGATMSYGQGFVAVLLTGLVFVVLSAVTGYIHTAFIHPDLPQYVLSNIRSEMLSQGMPERQIEAAMGFWEKVMTPVGMIIFGLCVNFFITVFFALLHPIALVRRRPLAKVLIIYAIIFGSLGLVFGGLGGIPKGGFLLGAAKGLAINVACAVIGWGLLLKLTGYAADAPPPSPADSM